MQFYTMLLIDTGLTLSALGKWEEENPLEFEAYMQGYITLKERQAERNRRR